MEGFPSIEDLRSWADGLEEVQKRLAPYFERAEPRERAMSYIRGLMSITERKNGWQLAEVAGEARPDGMQRLLNTAKWDADEVRDDLQQYILTHLADPQAVLVVDETGFVKKGSKSAGVAPQYSGTVGKIANSQIGVFLAYANRSGAVLLDRELYLPGDWEKDPERCQEADVPEERRTTITKPMLAKQMLERAFAHGIKAAWVTGDTVYGGDYKLRSWLEERLQPYVLAVPKNQRIGLSRRADEVVASWPAEQWQRLSAGEGSQGPRLYDWAWQELSYRWTQPGWKQWLLARRSLSDPSEIAYYFVFAPQTVSLEQVVLAAGSRWQVEEAFELAKQQVGLDEYEVRHWQGWYRHITLSMFALAFLTVVKVAGQKRGPKFRSMKPLRCSL
jgi:SRSO17 transposase